MWRGVGSGEPDVVDLGNAQAEICVVGRTTFTNGIGAISYAACELFSRNYPVCILPTDHPVVPGTITLPNGRRIPICTDASRVKVFFFVDVLWNGAYDVNYLRVPMHGLRVAHIAYDSDQLPDRWVDALNGVFNVALFSSKHLEDVARAGGVRIPIGTLPIAIDSEPLLVRPWRAPTPGRVRFGSIAAFHERKGTQLLLRAFLDAFDDSKDVELVLHSNLAIGEDYARAREIADGHENITVSHENLTPDEKTDLLDSFDVFVSASRGEGYSIGPREALALGKGLVLSGIGAHQDLCGVPGVIEVPATVRMPARYPEIDDQVFGHQYSVDVSSLATGLRRAADLVPTPEFAEGVRGRRARAAEFSFSRLSTDYAEVVNPTVRRFRTSARGSAYVSLPVDVRERALDVVGPHGSGLSHRSRTIVPAHDGGFFSVFNAFVSHLVWDLQEERCHLVLPDWDVARLVDRMAPEPIRSFCYGRPVDGNIWLKLFEPLYGLSDAEMNDVASLYHNAARPTTVYNQHREPYLTYIHAYELYRRPTFPFVRSQYHRVVTDHIRLRPALAKQIDDFCDREFGERTMIAAHVKHPSHAVEQPGQAMAQVRSYVDAVYEQLDRRGVDRSSPEWGVFLATDQDRVVKVFREEFEDRLSYYPDVRRTSLDEDAAYDALDESNKIQEGHQVQHLVAADSSGWNVRMAEEVIRDMVTMSRCSVLLHVVSNVSTAAAFFNPQLELVFTQ
jgi:glycosyltransferase involved in cell wall biosynthesis